MIEQRPSRKNVRLKEYDYSRPGYYFVTVCAAKRQEIFGNVVSGRVAYSPTGIIATEEIAAIEAHRPNVRVERWVVMPNHVHMILQIVGRDMTCHVHPEDWNGRNRFSRPQKDSLGMIVGAYKADVTRRLRTAMTNHGPTELWQGRYYERTIRNEREYMKISRYIDENPLKWELDEYYQA